MVTTPDFVHVLGQRRHVRLAPVTADGVGDVDDDADDDHDDEDDEAEPEENSLEFVDAEVLEDDDTQEKTAEETTRVSQVTNLGLTRLYKQG